MVMKASLIPMIFLSLSLFGSVSSQSDSCSSKLMTTVSNLIPFNTSSLHCFSAWKSQGFILRYAKTGPSQWSYILSAPDTGSYIAIGFSDDGRMVGSSAVTGWITSSGPGIVKQYYLAGTSSHQCPPDQGNLLLVLKNSLIISMSSTLYLAFQQNTAKPQPYLIYAVGPQNRLPSSDNYLPEHRNMASASINYDTGVSSDEAEGSGFGSVRKHGVLVMLGWGILMPIGITIARYFKQFDPLWFYSHLSIQGVGLVLGLGGVIIGFGLDDEEGGGDIDSHKALGICILVFGCLQVMAFLARPNKESKVRRYWNWYHYYVGRAAVACAIGNIFFGFSLAHESSSWSIGYGVFLGIWVIACIILEVRRCCMNRE